jgi:hypothetical protein
MINVVGMQISPRMTTLNHKSETETIKPDEVNTLDIENVGFHGRSPSPR